MGEPVGRIGHPVPVTEAALAARLAGECPRRVCPALHAALAYVHVINPSRGCVCCFDAGSEMPEGWPYSGAQESLLRLRGVPDGG